MTGSQTMKSTFARLACAAVLLVLAAAAAIAQSYPSRQITLVVPFAPGGPADEAFHTPARNRVHNPSIQLNASPVTRREQFVSGNRHNES
jgi:hypothetical protein